MCESTKVTCSREKFNYAQQYLNEPSRKKKCRSEKSILKFPSLSYYL